MALDYETDVKQYAITLLAGDLFGKGRVEAAIFKTFQHVHNQGYDEGFALGLQKNDARVEVLERQLEESQKITQHYRDFWLDAVEELSRKIEQDNKLKDLMTF